MSSITVEQYSEKAIVVRGNTIQYKEKLLSIGGKWNKMLKGGEGWIFPLTKKPVVEKALSEQPSVYENDSSDNDNSNYQKTKNTYKSTDRKYEKSTSHDNVSEVVLTKKEYLHLISRIERLEQLVARFSDNDEPQKEQKEQKEPKEPKKRNSALRADVKDKKSKLPPPLSSISDSDLHDPINYEDNIEYNSDNSDSERQPVQRLLRKKN